MDAALSSHESIPEADESEQEDVSDKSDEENFEGNVQPQGSSMPVDMFFSCYDWEAAREDERQAELPDENFSDSGENLLNNNIQNDHANKRLLKQEAKAA